MKKIIAVILIIADICMPAVIIKGYADHKADEKTREELRYSTELYDRMKTEKEEERNGEYKNFSQQFLLGDSYEEQDNAVQNTEERDSAGQDTENRNTEKQNTVDISLEVGDLEIPEFSEEDLSFENTDTGVRQ